MQSNELNLPDRRDLQLFEQGVDEILYSQVGQNKVIYKKQGTSFVVKKSKHNNYTMNQTKICTDVIIKKPKHIVQIYDTWKSQNQFNFILMKYYPYTLSTYLIQRKEYLDENPQLRLQIILQIIYGLIQLRCMHRDLKLENILVQELPDKKIKVVLIDFNTCNHGQALNSSRIGTYSYMAPQIMFMRDGQVIPYTRIVDMWSLGIIVYKIFMGEKQWPYNFKFSFDQSRSKQQQQFKSCVRQNKISLLKQLPSIAKYLIRQMLETDPKNRISLILTLTKLKQPELKQIYHPQNTNNLTESQKQLKQHYQKEVEIEVEIEKSEQNILKTIQKIKSYFQIYQKYFQIQPKKWIWQYEQFKYNKAVAFVHRILSNMIVPYKQLEKNSRIKKSALSIIIFGSEKDMQLVKEQEIYLSKQLRDHIFKRKMNESQKNQLLNCNFQEIPLVKSSLAMLIGKLRVEQMLETYIKLKQ